MYTEKEFAPYSAAEYTPGDGLKAFACIVLVVSIMAMVLAGFKHRAETASKAEQRAMAEEVIIP